MFQPEALVNRTRSGAKELSRQGYRGRRGDAGKTEGQPHASPPELATDTLGRSRLARFRLPNASDIHTAISGYATKIVVRATDDELILPRSGN